MCHSISDKKELSELIQQLERGERECVTVKIDEVCDDSVQEPLIIDEIFEQEPIKYQRHGHKTWELKPSEDSANTTSESSPSTREYTFFAILTLSLLLLLGYTNLESVQRMGNVVWVYFSDNIVQIITGAIASLLATGIATVIALIIAYIGLKKYLNRW